MITLDGSRARQMATLDKIADYWRTAEETEAVLPELASHWIGWGEPFCFACGWLAPVADGPDAWCTARLGSWLERAHLVDHSIGGTGEPSNLAPLCVLCHDDMPSLIEDRRTALEWITARRSPMPRFELWQMFTDGAGPGSGGGSSRARMHRLRGDYLLALSEAAARVSA